MRRDALIFCCGMALAALLGWGAFPHALYVSREQPVRFHHESHAGKSGVTQCDTCHAIGPDGQFAGIPQTETCAGCHSQEVGKSKDEAVLVNDYVRRGRAIPWLIYSRQPANVSFSHAIHVGKAGLSCSACHATYGASDSLPASEQDRISGYSRGTMSMSQCESCHRSHHLQVGCFDCHQ